MDEDELNSKHSRKSISLMESKKTKGIIMYSEIFALFSGETELF